MTARATAAASAVRANASHVEQADLISYGMLGLIEAMDRFEPKRQIRFETFAMQRIRGAIMLNGSRYDQVLMDLLRSELELKHVARFRDLEREAEQCQQFLPAG